MYACAYHFEKYSESTSERWRMFLEWCTGYLLLSNKLPQICWLRTVPFIITQSLWVRNPTQSNCALWPIIGTDKLLLSVSYNSKNLTRNHHTPHSLTWLLAGFSSLQLVRNCSPQFTKLQGTKSCQQPCKGVWSVVVPSQVF